MSDIFGTGKKMHLKIFLVILPDFILKKAETRAKTSAETWAFIALKFHVGQKNAFLINTFWRILPSLGPTYNAIFSAICSCRTLFSIFFLICEEKSF